MDTKKLVAGAVVAAVLIVGAGTALAAQQGTSPGQEDEPAATGNLSASEENETEGSENEGSENEAGEEEESEESLTGSTAKQAAEAALRATGGGTVLEVEAGDDPDAAYEVEISKPDGSIAEVMLDSNLDVIGQATDD